MKMFSATDRSGNSVGSWWMIEMPAAREAFGPLKVTGWPPTTSVPPSA
jgi:hypothetical protein